MQINDPNVLQMKGYDGNTLQSDYSSSMNFIYSMVLPKPLLYTHAHLTNQ